MRKTVPSRERADLEIGSGISGSIPPSDGSQAGSQKASFQEHMPTKEGS